MFKYIIGLIVIIAVVIIFRHKDIFVSKLSVKINLKGISVEIENKEKKRPSSQD